MPPPMFCVCIFVCTALLTGEEAPEPAPTDAERTAIDAVALAAEPYGWTQADRALEGELLGTILDLLRLPPERIRQMARSLPPESAPTLGEATDLAALLARLTAALPKPTERRAWRLVAVGGDTVRCQALGDGAILVSDGWRRRYRDRPDLAALILAREMGRDVLGFVERAYLLADLTTAVEDAPLLASITRHLQGDGEADAARRLLEALAADRYALHLAGMAGLDGTPLFDGLRRRASDDAIARERLRHLLLDRDGLVEDTATYGLHRFDPQSGSLIRLPGPVIWPEGSRPIVVTHGLEGIGADCLDALQAFAQDGRLADRPFVCFVWPNDRAIDGMGRFLLREVARTGLPAARTSFVAHSAGGLVVRWFLQQEGGQAERLLCAGTPHGGSDLATISGFLEALQVCGQGWLETGQALRHTLTDGRRQLAMDLRRDSLVLALLAQAGAPNVPVRVLRGQVLSARAAAMMRLTVDAARNPLRHRAAGLTRQARLDELLGNAVDRLEIPRSILYGDLAVCLADAECPGAVAMQTVDRNHLELMHARDCLAILADWLTLP